MSGRVVPAIQALGVVKGKAVELPEGVQSAFEDEGRASRHPCLGAVSPSMA